jgi:hypothetical protein
MEGVQGAAVFFNKFTVTGILGLKRTKASDYSDHPVLPIYRMITASVVLSSTTEKSRSTTKTGKNPEMVFLLIV